jgi:hypothetical protein
MAKGYEAITWLAGNVFLKRGFAKRLGRVGLDTVMEECPYDDLTKEQRTAVLAAMKEPLLEGIVQTWWDAYATLRIAGELPAATRNGDPWMP